MKKINRIISAISTLCIMSTMICSSVYADNSETLTSEDIKIFEQLKESDEEVICDFELNDNIPMTIKDEYKFVLSRPGEFDKAIDYIPYTLYYGEDGESISTILAKPADILELAKLGLFKSVIINDKKDITDLVKPVIKKPNINPNDIAELHNQGFTSIEIIERLAEQNTDQYLKCNAELNPDAEITTISDGYNERDIIRINGVDLTFDKVGDYHISKNYVLPAVDFQAKPNTILELNKLLVFKSIELYIPPTLEEQRKEIGDKLRVRLEQLGDRAQIEVQMSNNENIEDYLLPGTTRVDSWISKQNDVLRATPDILGKYIDMYEKDLFSDNPKFVYMSVDPVVRPVATNDLTISYKTTAGDINSDGKADLSDLSEISLAILGDKSFTEAQKKAADVDGDGDGELSLADLAKFKQYITKQIESLG